MKNPRTFVSTSAFARLLLALAVICALAAHAIAQQIQGRDSHYEDVGKAILSADLDTPPTAR